MNTDAKIVLWWIAEVMIGSALLIGVCLLTVKLTVGFWGLTFTEVVSIPIVIAAMTWLIGFVHDVCEFGIEDLMLKEDGR